MAKKYLDGAGLSTVLSKLKSLISEKANASHSHAASDITSGTLPVSRGGTGNTSIDTTPTSGSTKMVTSGGVYTALSGKANSSHSHSEATTSAAGFLSASDKSKLDGITAGANKYTHPSYTAKTSGLYKVTVDSTGHVSAATAVTKSDITALGIPESDTNTTYSEATTSASGLMSADDKTKLNGIATGANKYTHPSYTAKSSGLYKVTVDASGHVSATAAVAKSDITGLGIPAQDTTYSAMTAATSSAAGKAGLVPAPAAGAQAKFLRGDGTWQTPANTTYSAMTGATSSAAGEAGLVPAPAAGKQTSFLRGDGTWAVPTDTKYTHPTTSGNKHIPSGGSSGQILRWSADGTAVWGADNDTTYSAATTSAAGLMSASDKSKLDGIATGANKYSLPTASSSTLGGVKTTSTVTSTSGLTACPIIGGVPYYKDTNDTYTLSSFGITATAAELNKLDGVTATATELNYVDGVTSNIQTQLNGKASSTHTHEVATNAEIDTAFAGV